jgi:hypothetical protein
MAAMTPKTLHNDERVVVRAPSRIVNEFKEVAEEAGTGVATQVRMAMELVYALRMMDSLADPKNLRANAAHLGGADEVRIYWESFRDDALGLLAKLVPGASERHRRTLPDFMWQEPPSRDKRNKA